MARFVGVLACVLAFAHHVSGAPQTPSSDVLVERILAVAGGRVITLTDIEAARLFGLVPQLSPYADPIRAVLSPVIERALMLAEVDRYAPTEPSEAAVAASLREIRARFASDSDYMAALARTGLNDGRLREMVRENERIRAYLNQRFPGLPINDEEARSYFDAHTDRFPDAASFEDVRGAVLAAAVAEQRRLRIVEWALGLRRRADITDLWLPEP